METLITDKDYYEKIKACGKEPPENTLVRLLIKNKMKIATAESCTGGMISEKITNVSGASKVFDCGVCSYANDIKEKILGVSPGTLNTLGAVSGSVARQMARGVMNLACADAGLSTTGIAGPTGGTPDKPVGLVYIAFCHREDTAIYRAELCKYKQHTRNEVRLMAANLALMLAGDKIRLKPDLASDAP